MTTPASFDAKGNPDAIFVIQSDAAMNTTTATTMHLINGAKTASIYWVTTGAVTVGDTSTIDGRAFSVTAAVTLPGTIIKQD